MRIVSNVPPVTTKHNARPARFGAAPSHQYRRAGHRSCSGAVSKIEDKPPRTYTSLTRALRIDWAVTIVTPESRKITARRLRAFHPAVHHGGDRTLYKGSVT